MLGEKPARIQPSPTRMPPRIPVFRGPHRSTSPPASAIPRANTARNTMNGRPLEVALIPHSSSSGFRNTLNA